MQDLNRMYGDSVKYAPFYLPAPSKIKERICKLTHEEIYYVPYFYARPLNQMEEQEAQLQNFKKFLSIYENERQEMGHLKRRITEGRTAKTHALSQQFF